MNFSRILSIALIPALSFTADFRNWDTYPGSTAFSYAQSFQGPRQNALSNAAPSLPSADLFSILANPATIDTATLKHSVAIAWEEGALQRQQAMLSYRFDMGFAPIQATIAWIGHDEIQGTEMGNSDDLVETGTIYAPTSQMWMLSTLLPTQHFQVGVSIKWLSEHLGGEATDQDGMALGFDWGLRSRNPQLRYGWSFAVMDLGGQIRAYTQNGVDSLPLNTRIHLGGHYKPSAIRGLTVFCDAEAPRYSPWVAHLGAEWTPAPWLALRAGTQSPFAEWNARIRGKTYEGANLYQWGSFGAGLNWGRWNLDYAMVLLRDELGLKHTLGLRAGI